MLSEARLMEINPGRGWQLETGLNEGREVFLPDPEFYPMLATRLAAEVVHQKIAPPKARLLIQQLVPLAVTDLSALDAVIAYLLFVSELRMEEKHMDADIILYRQHILSVIDPSPIGGTTSGDYDEMLANV